MHVWTMRFVGLLVVALIASGCSKQSVPPDVSSALSEAGANQGQLQSVIDHYEELGDSLKLQAAYFLIGNMGGHSYVTYRFFDTANQTVNVDVASFPNYDSLMQWIDSVQGVRGELDYERDSTAEDLKAITSDYLIQNIDLAFEAWQTKPWAKNLNFDNFCNYVLPYRGSNEPIESWRKYFFVKYAGLQDSLENPNSAIQAAAAINNGVRSWFKFDERWYLHPTDQGFAEMIKTGFGRCEDMTNLSIYAMRANALAVTSDYTPYWATCGNNHAWNAILNDDGRVIPFMGAEANPGDYKLANDAAKVYRKTYNAIKTNLVFQPHKQKAIPRWLAGKNYVDVTADYYDVCDVTVDIDSTVPDSVDIAYICVFNDGEFKPIHWGRIDGQSVTFTDMNRGLLYLPAFYLNEKVVPCGAPFVLTSDCQQRNLQTDDASKVTVTASHIPQRAMAASTESLKARALTKGKKYELQYWNDGWQTAGTKECKSSNVTFSDVPSGGLYWLVTVDGNKDERPFTVEDGKHVFW